VKAGGPFFEDLERGQVFRDAPAVTLTSGMAAVHQAIVGDRLRIALDHTDRPVAHPALVWDVAIGQSTVATHRVLANLLYRGLLLRRHPAIGDTLRTTTEVEALRETSRKPGRPGRGLALLRITTVDQEDRPVLDFRRVAMLPLRDEAPTGHDDDLGGPQDLADADLHAATSEFGKVPGTFPHFEGALEVEGGDVVSSAPELARLSLNVAMAHHDRTRTGTGRRLVYGGHTIGIAAAQASRALPGLVTIVGWHGCDHVGPVLEEDLLTSTLEVERVDGALVHLRSRVDAQTGDDEPRPVLDWRFVAVHA
jgi:acyl dehydratase